jgi:hypothetical protein
MPGVDSVSSGNVNPAPDSFFSAEQQRRLRELLACQEQAKAAGVPMSAADRAELQLLIDAELDGASRRGLALLRAQKR